MDGNKQATTTDAVPLETLDSYVDQLDNGEVTRT